MAPFKIYTSSVELLEPEVTKPSPLRIIKRSKTVTSSSSSREAFGRGCQRTSISSSSIHSKGSPPSGSDRPLTVRKKRQGGENTLDASSEDVDWNKENLPPFGLTSGANDEDSDITPKARQRISRTISAGNFLKSEFHRRSMDEQSRSSVRNNRTPFHPPQFASHIPTPPPSASAKDRTYHPPERKPSKSKSFILRALAGRSSHESINNRSLNSKGSRNTLVRRLSRNKTLDPLQSQRSSISGDTLYSTELDDLDFGDGHRSSIPARPLPQQPTLPHEELIAPRETSLQAMLVLSPRIKVTPQINSLPTATSTIWVAIEIKGELHAADGHYDMHPSRRRCSSELLDIQNQDISRYGNLFDIRIQVRPPHGSALLDYIGDLHFNLNALETRLILAKVRIDGVSTNPSPAARDPEVLMVELQNHLGDTLTKYLTVIAVYKHSAFTVWEADNAASEGTYFHSTHLQTEISVAIKRHDPLSAWSPRNSAAFNEPPHSDQFNELIQRHLPPDKAAQAFAIIHKDQPRRPSYIHRASAGQTRTERVSSSSRNALGATPPQTPLSRAKSRTTGPIAMSPLTPVRRSQHAEEDEGENDPARKIWASMREVSRGGRPRHHPRKSISADHYNLVDDEDSLSKLHARHSLDDLTRDQSFDSFDDSGIELERSKIKEVALKNKRSIGAETLRSMAPSVGKVVKGKGTPTGLGIRSGVWGWGNFWG